VVGNPKRLLFLQRRAKFFRQNANVGYKHSYPQTPSKFQRRAALQPTTANTIAAENVMAANIGESEYDATSFILRQTVNSNHSPVFKRHLLIHGL